MKRLIALRKRFKAFGRGTLEFLHPDNHKVLAFVRRYQDECVLVLANLSRFVQGVELDLSPYKGQVPVEIFGRTEFPVVGEAPYFVTMGPHVLLVLPRTPASPGNSADASGGAAAYAADQRCAGKSLYGRGQVALEAILPTYLKERRWFGGKARKMKSVQLLEAIPVHLSPPKPISRCCRSITPRATPTSMCCR